ncbi:hypothetical protein, partial [Klebsiella oxytoca]|uniref:hypothetical protein n=1 Tax=Klebsiella oxytoca TaxID=571 RepID=UPI0013D1AA0B
DYPVSEITSLRITRSSRVAFANEIGFIAGSAKAEKLAALNERVGTYLDPMSDKFASLTPLGEQIVYDLTESNTHHFIANGIVVHNCSEYLFL